MQISNKLIFSILILIPFLQLGVSFYESVSFTIFVISFLWSLSILREKNKEKDIVLIGCLLFLFKSFLLIFESFDEKEILITIRELVCFTGVILISQKISKARIKLIILKKVIQFLLFIILLISVLQVYFISKGQYFGFPIEYYVMNKETLDFAEQALFHGTRYRPTSFYGEPSYTGWIVLSIITIVTLRNEFTTKFKALTFLFGFTIVIISGAFGGIISVGVFAIFYYVRLNKSNTRIIVISLISIGLFVAFNFLSELNTRITDIALSSDESSIIRFSRPFLYLKESFFEGKIFGVNNYSELAIDNAGLGLLIHYGILAILLMILIIKFIQNKILVLFLLLALNFNGSFFSFDKIIVLSLVIGLGKCTLIDRKFKLSNNLNVEKYKNGISIIKNIE